MTHYEVILKSGFSPEDAQFMAEGKWYIMQCTFDGEPGLYRLHVGADGRAQSYFFIPNMTRYDDDIEVTPDEFWAINDRATRLQPPIPGGTQTNYQYVTGANTYDPHSEVDDDTDTDDYSEVDDDTDTDDFYHRLML